MAPKKENKGKAKEVARFSTPPPFIIRSPHLGRDFNNLYTWVENLIEAQLRVERNRENPLHRMPERVKGKLYTPSTKGVFLVAFTHDDMVVTLMFELHSLYFTAFHARGVWYCLSECDVSDLPLPSVLAYNKVIKLSISCSYDNIGGTEVTFSQKQFMNCVCELWKAGAYLDLGVIMEKLCSGPLSFPVISVPEALRFLLLRSWMKGTVVSKKSSPRVPERFTRYFTTWDTYSDGFVKDTPVPDVVDNPSGNELADTVGNNGSNHCKMISVDKLTEMLGILNGKRVKPIKSRWFDPRSSKMGEAQSQPSKAATQAIIKWSSDKVKARNVGGYDPEPSNVSTRLNSAISTEKPNINQNDAADVESSKQVLKDDVIFPTKLQHIPKDAQRPGMATLLYGPPGSGKSHWVRAFADENESTFLSICPSDFVPKSPAESEKRVAEVFENSREKSPSLVFIDEIDSLCGYCGEGNESEASKRIRTELLVQMQCVGENAGVDVVAATNKPYALDQDVRQLFDTRIQFRLPDQEARLRMFKGHLGEARHELSGGDFEDFAQQTEGFSYVDITACVKSVLSKVREGAKESEFFIPVYGDGDDDDDVSVVKWIPCRSEEPGARRRTMQELVMRGFASKIVAPAVLRKDVLDVISEHGPSVSVEDLEQYQMFSDEFG